MPEPNTTTNTLIIFRLRMFSFFFCINDSGLKSMDLLEPNHFLEPLLDRYK